MDVDAARRRINIETKGRERGEENYPSGDSTSPDSVELEIRAICQDVLQRYVEEYEGQIEAYRERLKVIGANFGGISLVSGFKKTLGDMRAELKKVKDRLFEKEGLVKALAGEVTLFRRKNQLEHCVPVESNSNQVVFSLVAMSAIEGLLTFFLIREVGDVITIIMQASTFIVLNVFISFFFLGSWAKYKNVKNNILAKTTGYIVCAFWLAYALCVNLLFSHYRTLASELTQRSISSSEGVFEEFVQIHTTTLESFIANPFGLNDILAWALFVIGFALSTYAFRKGYLNNDVYPGYGDLKKRYDKYYQDYCNSAELAVKLFRTQRELGMQKAETAITELQQDSHDVPTIMSNALALKIRLQQAINHLNVDLETLTKEYRAANEIARSEKTPHYFNNFEPLKTPEVSVFNEEAPTGAEMTLEKVFQHRDEIHDLFDTAIQEVEAMENLMQAEYPFKVERPL